MSTFLSSIIPRVSLLKAKKACERIHITHESATKFNLSVREKFTSSGIMGNEDNLNIVKKSIKSYPDFPKPGVLFRDLFSLMKNPKSFQALNKLIVEHVEKLTTKPDAVIGLEARGFLLGPLIALQVGIPFVPIRKKGKLPGHVSQQSYELEYGVDMFEIQTESICQGQNVIIVDDLLATGGSLQAACKLVSTLGACVEQCIVIMELLELGGRKAVEVPVHSFIQY